MRTTIIDPEAALEWRSRRRRLFVFAALLFGFFILGRIGLSEWVDLLWFRSLGYALVFWTTIWLQATIFVIAAVITFAVLYVAFWGAEQRRQPARML